MTSEKLSDRQEAFKRVRQALWTMPYSGGIGVDWAGMAGDDDAVLVTSRVNAIAVSLERLAETLSIVAARQEADKVELDKFRRWHRTLAEIAGSLGAPS